VTGSKLYFRFSLHQTWRTSRCTRNCLKIWDFVQKASLEFLSFSLISAVCCAIARAISRRLLRCPEFDLRSVHIGFVVEKVALSQVFIDCLWFLCQFSFHDMIPYPGIIGPNMAADSMDSVSPHRAN
jgi:hypothetical protein